MIRRVRPMTLGQSGQLSLEIEATPRILEAIAAAMRADQADREKESEEAMLAYRAAGGEGV